jgi:phosphoribosylamine--glycine ligase
MRRVQDEVLLPTLEALRADERPFRGLLYAGLMITNDGPRVIEFNARFGDPETQALLPLLQSSLLEPMLAIGRGESIESMKLEWSASAACTTVLAAGGYPGAPRTGCEIRIPDDIERDGVRVYHAGTRVEDGRLLTDGGRVLAVTAVAGTLEVAAGLSRDAAERIDFEGKQYRSDIGWREIARNAGAA